MVLADLRQQSEVEISRIDGRLQILSFSAHCPLRSNLGFTTKLLLNHSLVVSCAQLFGFTTHRGKWAIWNSTRILWLPRESQARRSDA